jgi:hypothetical protein
VGGDVVLSPDDADDDSTAFVLRLPRA